MTTYLTWAVSLLHCLDLRCVRQQLAWVTYRLAPR
jgi:hypothetical protein